MLSGCATHAHFTEQNTAAFIFCIAPTIAVERPGILVFLNFDPIGTLDRLSDGGITKTVFSIAVESSYQFLISLCLRHSHHK